MKKTSPRSDDAVDAVVDLERLNGLRRMGRLHRQRSGQGDLFSFEYDREWLEHAEVFQFDPDLRLGEGRIYAPVDRENFGIFLDSSPDRWGRLLMQRRAARYAAKNGKPAPTLTSWDYLLGVHDSTRLGALRFRRSGDEPFLDNSADLPAPPLARLQDLQAVSLSLEDERAEDNPNYDSWLAQLVAPGSSLGGARPKAAVIDEQGRPCIAKFPSRKDTQDVGGWEFVVHVLAERAGIRVAPARPLLLGKEGHTFLTRRFDRTDSGGRKAFVSAMTLLQRKDGEPGASYLEIVELLQARGANTKSASTQLFRRVVFNICVSNTDDHLRNHGFFIEPGGLMLAPAYDMNPNPGRRELSIAIDEANAICDIEVALNAAYDYGLSLSQAAGVVAEVRAAVSTWRNEAANLGIGRAEQNRMQAAFR